MSLDSCLIGDWSDGFGEVSGCGNCVCLSGLDCLSLQVNVDTLILCLPPLGRIVLHTVDELLATFGVLDVLNADVDTLLQVAVADTLVDDDTEGGLGDVVDNTGLSVVDFVWHTIELSESYFTILYNSVRMSSRSAVRWVTVLDVRVDIN